MPQKTLGDLDWNCILANMGRTDTFVILTLPINKPDGLSFYVFSNVYVKVLKYLKYG